MWGIGDLLEGNARCTRACGAVALPTATCTCAKPSGLLAGRLVAVRDAWKPSVCGLWSTQPGGSPAMGGW